MDDQAPLLILVCALLFPIACMYYDYVMKVTKPRRPFLLGLHGKVGAGKDTAAACIPHTHQLAFAEPLKQAAMILFQFTPEQVYDPIQKEIVDERWGKSPRQILQWLGSDVLREKWPDFFIRHMDFRVKGAWRECMTPQIIITDCRFPNEAEYIHTLPDSKVIRIIREGENRTEHHTHASEQGLPEEMIDVTLYNKGTLEEFKEVVKQFHSQL